MSVSEESNNTSGVVGSLGKNGYFGLCFQYKEFLY